MIDGQPLACFQPFIDTATGRIAGVEALGRLRQPDGRLLSVGPLFADPRTPGVTLRRLDRQIRENALSRLHEVPEDWFLSLNISPRWINRLRPGQALPSLKQVHALGVDPRRLMLPGRRGPSAGGGDVGGADRGGDAGSRGCTKWNRPTRAVPMRVVALLKAVSGGREVARGGRS